MEQGLDALTEIEGFEVPVFYACCCKGALENVCAQRALEGDEAPVFEDFPV